MALPPPQNTTTENLSFPPDLTSATNHYMIFRFEKYRRRAINRRPEKIPSGNTIRLPIPNNVKDAFAVNYSNENLGSVVGSAVEAIVNTQNLPSTLPGAVGSIASSALQVAGAVGLETLNNAIQQGAAALRGPFGATAQEAARSIRPAAEQLLGIGINPYVTVMFKNPQYKEHQFDWRFVPRNANESQIVMKIIKQFKKSMLPGINALTAETNLLFDYPDVLQVEINPYNEYMYKFKTCVVKNLVVNYAPASTPAFFQSTGAPAAVTMSIQLGEIEYWTQRDFEERR